MKPKFLNYNIEQLLEEKLFVSYVLRNENKNEWEKFLQNHPEFRLKAHKANEIINLLQDSYDLIDEKSILEIWNRINQSNSKNKEKALKIKIRRRFSWAALILLLIATGIAGIYYANSWNYYYSFYPSTEIGSNESRIVLSTGEKIALQKNNSTIVLNDKTNQIAVNDSIIELPLEAEAEKITERMNEVIVPYGQKTELVLADGTTVWLNAGSRLAFPSKFRGKLREVFLEGEACFKVAENKSFPFVVKTNDLNIKVLGTHFNVSAYPTDEFIETVLLEGKVEVAQPKAFGLRTRDVVLAPNQKANFKREVNEITVSDDQNVDKYISWTYGWLKYERESLWSVLKKVERYYNVEIILPDNYPGDDLITGKLDLKASLDDVMVVLADASEFNYRINGNSINIEKKLNDW